MLTILYLHTVETFFQMPKSDKWSCCSSDDFKDNVQNSIDMNGEYCLKPNYATSAMPVQDGNPCGSPENYKDGQCDDDNNNEDCGYDGGDCCPGDDPPQSWNTFCTECKCIKDKGKHFLTTNGAIHQQVCRHFHF